MDFDALALRALQILRAGLQRFAKRQHGHRHMIGAGDERSLRESASSVSRDDPDLLSSRLVAVADRAIAHDLPPHRVRQPRKGDLDVVRPGARITRRASTFLPSPSVSIRAQNPSPLRDKASTRPWTSLPPA